MAFDLWSCTDPDRWAQALDAYSSAIERRGGPKLTSLDEWYRATLPALLAGRQPSRLLHEELVRITEWKMRRGVFRPRNLMLVRKNSPDAVESASARAFIAAADPDEGKKAVHELIVLDGVGPATASGVLAAFRPERFPFLDDEVASQIPSLGAVAFSTAFYVRYADALCLRAHALSNARAPWTADAAARALWAEGAGADSTKSAKSAKSAKSDRKARPRKN